MLAVARRKDLSRLGGPHCCGVDGARYRLPEGSVVARRTPLQRRGRSSPSLAGRLSGARIDGKDRTYSGLQGFDWPVIAPCTTTAHDFLRTIFSVTHA